MNLKDLLDLTEKLESRISAYWNFYTVVVLAVGGWLFTKPALTFFEKCALAFVLFTFFAANLSVIYYATQRLTAFESEATALTSKAGVKSPALREQLLSLTIPRRMELSWMLHVVIDFAVLVVVFWS